MIQAKLLEMVLRAILKHPKMRELFKYKDEPNDCDIKVRDLEKKVTDVAFKVTASVDMIKSYSETIDNVATKVKSIDKIINKFDDKLKQIDKIAHPPAIPLKEINEFRSMKDEFKGIKDIFNKMKKIPILKSIFK